MTLTSNMVKNFTRNDKANIPNVPPDHDIDKRKVTNYFTNFHSIPGWFNIETAKVFLWLDLIHKKENIQGNLFEIGIFLGKSAILLALMADDKKEKLGLCDFFREGAKPGVNQKEILAKNFKTYLEDTSFINIYEKFSSGLTQEECKDCRFFHIDGEHTLTGLTGDLTLADSSIIEKGIITIDDFFNPGYPEVTEGIFKYLERKDSLSPVLISFGKLILCKKSSYNWYHDKLNSYDWKSYINNPKVTNKETKMSGTKLISLLYINPPPAIKALNTK